jgi:hypothetical protein
MSKIKSKKVAKLINQVVYDSNSSHQIVEFSPFDNEVSDKVKKLILGIIGFNDGISITFSKHEFSITVQDLTNIKNRVVKNNFFDENFFEITVMKNKGFSMCIGYHKKTDYKDKNIYKELINLVKVRVNEINTENLTYILTTVIKETGILRDNNLEELID